MTPDPELNRLIAKLLETALLQIRAFAWSGQTERVAIEADHVHNLPTLLISPQPELLDFYWDIERQGYLSQIPEAEAAIWEPIWNELEAYLALRHAKLVVRA